jgi:hypothetical protein
MHGARARVVYVCPSASPAPAPSLPPLPPGGDGGNTMASNTDTPPSKPAPPPVRLPDRPEPDAAPSPGAWLPVHASLRSPWPWPPSSPVTRTATYGSGSRTRRRSGTRAQRPPICRRRLAGCLVAPSSSRRPARPTQPNPSSFRGPDASHEVIEGQTGSVSSTDSGGRCCLPCADLRPAPGRKLSPPGAGRWQRTSFRPDRDHPRALPVKAHQSSVNCPVIGFTRSDQPILVSPCQS